MKSGVNKEVILFLFNIRSAHNVGAIFRTADAAGVSKIILAGYTPKPEDRFGRKRRDIAKAALGAEGTVPYSAADNPLSELRKLKKGGFRIIVLEQTNNSIDYKNLKLRSRKTVIVAGSEVEGVSAAILNLADDVIEIPMRGKKESLNVSTALGIALFRLLGI